MKGKNREVSDLDREKELLQNDCCTCALVCGEKEYLCDKRGIAPLLDFIDRGYNLKNFSAADKIVGKAAALLYVHLGVKCVYAQVLSQYAEEVFRKHRIFFEFGIKTEKIINRSGDGNCPMEQTVLNIDDPVTAIPALRQKLNSLLS